MKTKRQSLVSLLSMLGMAFVAFMVLGLMLNWNLFIVIGFFIPILIIGLALIFMPGWTLKVHKKLAGRIDDKITEVSKKVSKFK